MTIVFFADLQPKNFAHHTKNVAAGRTKHCFITNVSFVTKGALLKDQRLTCMECSRFSNLTQLRGHKFVTLKCGSDAGRGVRHLGSVFIVRRGAADVRCAVRG